MQPILNDRDKQHVDYEKHARKIWGHDDDPLNAEEGAGQPAVIPAVTIIADAAKAPAQSDNHGSASEIDTTVPPTSTAPAVKDGRVPQNAGATDSRKADAQLVSIALAKLPTGAGLAAPTGREPMSPADQYRDSWNNG